jgi:hypothetical protein
VKVELQRYSESFSFDGLQGVVLVRGARRSSPHIAVSLVEPDRTKGWFASLWLALKQPFDCARLDFPPRNGGVRSERQQRRTR